MPVAARRRAIAFIVLIGFVTLFADMTYEGGRSVAGPFLGMLGASAVIVSVVAGLGEFLGYGVRYLSGRAADRGGPYWTIMGAGYLINLLAVPLLAFAWSWPVAMLLLITERLGRAIRAPIRGAMLSHATSRTGAAWASACTPRSTRRAAWAGRFWSRACSRLARATAGASPSC